MTRWIYLHVIRPLRFWWQRRTRGWDDSVTWNLDVELARWLLPRLRRFKELQNGYPGTLTEMQWDLIIDDMLDGLEISASFLGAESDDELKVERRAWKLLSKWHRGLWW